MSYYGVYKSYTTLTDFRDTIFSYVVSAGWTLHDDINSNTKVYKSQGENGTYAPLYMRLYFSGSSVNIQAFAYWNNSTHVGSLKSDYTIADVTYGVANLFAVSKDFFLISQANIGYLYGCGFVEEIFSNVLTTTTDSISSGSSVSIPVVNSSGFKVGNNYQIHGVNYEGRDRLTVDDIPDSAHIVVASLPRNYASGAYFGQTPFPAAAGQYFPNNFYFINLYNSVGLTENSVVFIPLPMVSYYGPDPIADDWTLTPFYIYKATYGSVGYFNKGYLTFGTAATIKDTVGVSSSKLEQGTASSGGDNTMTDLSKSWSTNQFADKYLLIISGTGLGQSRKIVSNTSTIITVQDNWTLNPDGTSIYRIADYFYRYSGTYFWVKITEDFV